MTNTDPTTETPADPADTTPPTPEDGQDAPEPTEAPETTEAETAVSEGEDDPDTFPKSYVAKLRKEAAGYRDRAKDRDALAVRLHTELVRATGRACLP